MAEVLALPLFETLGRLDAAQAHLADPVRRSVEPKRGGSRPTVHIFQDLPSICTKKMQTTVPNNNA